MGGPTREEPPEDGVEFIHEDDGRITARDRETGVASYGDTKVEALRMLAEALELHEGGGDEGGGEPVNLRELAGILSDEEAETFRTTIAESYRNTKE